MIKELDYPAYANSGFQRISWGAVFAGTIVSLAVLVVLTALGSGIGLVAAPSAAAGGTSAATGFGIGAAVWMFVTGVISFYAGGWVAGRLTGIARVSESVIHGIVMWSLATVMLAFVFTSATVGALGAASGAVRSTIGTRPDATATATDAARRVDTEDIQNASRAAGAAGLFGFLMLLCNAGAAGYGAKAGTRVLRPVAMTETHRERVVH